MPANNGHIEWIIWAAPYSSVAIKKNELHSPTDLQRFSWALIE